MHRIFQRDLARIRLTIARAYVKVLTDGQLRQLCTVPLRRFEAAEHVENGVCGPRERVGVC